MSRLLRGETFNIIVHRKCVASLNRTTEEDKVLVGNITTERKLLQKSPLFKDQFQLHHDFRLLGSGFKEFKP